MEHLRRCVVVVLAACGIFLSACSTTLQPTAPIFKGTQVSVTPVASSPVTAASVPVPMKAPSAPEKVASEPTQSASAPSQLPSLKGLLTQIALAQAISEKYGCPLERAQEIVQYAEKFADSEFPHAEDILAIITVESSFNPYARQGGSRGLMQVLIRSNRSLIHFPFDIREQIRVGALILQTNYQQLQSRRGAVMAYNIGVGAYQRGRRATLYYQRYLNALQWVVSQETGPVSV